MNLGGTITIAVIFIHLLEFSALAKDQSNLEAPLDPEAVFGSFVSALSRGKPERAQRYTFMIEGDDKRLVALAEQGKALASEGKTISFVEVDIDGDVASVIYADAGVREDGSPDYDNVMMLKERGTWKVLMDSYLRPIRDRISDSQEKSFTILRSRGLKRVKELQREWEKKNVKKLKRAVEKSQE